MRGALPLLLAVAVGSTGGLAYLALRRSPRPPAGGAEPPAPPEEPAAADSAASPPGLRPYRTTATLVEDLRDALAGEEALRNERFWEVSRALAGTARRMLVHEAADEASPRVRALLVLAAGVHLPEDEHLLAFLRDREAVVRRAAVLAAAYREGGETYRFLGVGTPLGRPPEAVARRLERSREIESDEETRALLDRLLSARR